MLKKIVFCAVLALWLAACSSEDFPEQKQLVINSLAEGETMPETHSAALYDGVIFTGDRVGWFVRAGEVMALNQRAAKLSPGIKLAPGSVRQQASMATYRSKDLKSLKIEPVTLPPHLNVKHDEFYEKFISDMPEDEVRIYNHGGFETVSYGHWSYPGTAEYYEKGKYTLTEEAGWVTGLDVLVFHSRTPGDQNGKFNMVPRMVLERVFKIVEPESAAQLYENLIEPLEDLTANQVEFLHGGLRYTSRREEIENHPDYPGRENIRLIIAPEAAAK